MKKILHILFILFLLHTFQLNANDMYFQVLGETGLYSSFTKVAEGSYEQTIEKGRKLELMLGSTTFLDVTDNSGNNEIIAFKFISNGQKFFIEANAIAPLETEVIFNPSILTDLNSADRKTYIPVYYTDILASLERENLFQYEPYWSDPKNPDFLTPTGEDWIPWHQFFHINWPSLERSMFSNSAITINDYWVAMKNIREIDSGYIITGKFIYGYPDRQYGVKFDFSSFENKEFCDITIKIDGDYIEYYLENETYKLATVVSVNQKFITQFDNLIQTNNADLSHITWPTRADGSMDYPIPSNVLLQNFIPTHKTKEEIPLLTEDFTESTAAAILPDQTPLRWIGKGTEGRIKVLTSEGLEGWCSVDKLENLVEQSVSYEALPVPELPPPPAPVIRYIEGTDNPFYPVYITKPEALKLREKPSFSAKYEKTLPERTEVQVLEYGPEKTIDYVKGRWLKIQNQEGLSGWCFSERLEAIPGAEPAPIPPSQSEGKIILFFRSPVGIGLGAVALILVFILIVKRRKKKES